MTDEIYHPHWQNIIKSYFKANGFVKHQIDSFNEFIEVGIQKILNEIGSIEIKTTEESRGGKAVYIFEFGQISIKKPVIREHDGTTNIMYPQEARNRNLTYHSSLYCDIKVKTIKNGEETVKISKEQLGYIPIMIRSKFCLLYNKTEKECKELGECIYDEGGYFIVNGNEKAIVAQERMPNNIVFCFYKKPPSKIIWQAELRSQFEYHIKTTSTFYVRIFSKGSRTMSNSNPTFTDIDGIRGQITYIKQDIPIVFIFYALGFTNKNEIVDIVTNSKIPLSTSTNDEYFKNILKFLRCSFDEANEIIKEENLENQDVKINESNLQEFCLDYIGRKGSTIYGSKTERIKYATQIINREMLPHLSLTYEDIFKNELQITKTKAHFIGYMINKLYTSYLGITKENDRDHLANKRLDLTGNLLTSLFKGIFKRLYKEAKVNLTKSIEANNSFDLMNNIKSKSITNDIKYALGTGNWGRQTGGTPPKTGVAQQLNRLTFSSGISHLRRLNTPLNREGKQAKPRQLHSTNWAYVCPCETPEGQGCIEITTPILSDDGSLIPIKELEKTYEGTSISTIDIKTREIEPTGINAFQNHDTKKFGNKILRVTTVSGRSIVLTSDHPFAAPGDTFIEAGNIKIGDKVLIYPTSIDQLKNEVSDKIILDKESYKQIIRKYDLVLGDTIDKDIEKLEKKGLLPLNNNDKRLEIIAALIGYCDTDGNITDSVNFCMGCEKDAEMIKNATFLIGLGDTSEIKEYKTNQTLTDGRINHSTWRISLDKNLSRLVIALGAIVGIKTTQESRVPEFIKFCNLQVKASYLSALFGGDGETLTYIENNTLTRKSSRWQISPPGFGNTKIESLAKNLELYLDEIKGLLSEFGINSRKTQEQTDDQGLETKIKRRFYIESDLSNLLKFANNISFKWCKHKQNKLLITSEYIRYLQNYINETSFKRQEARRLHDLGFGPTEISKQVGISLKRVEYMFYSEPHENMAISRDYVKWPNFLINSDANFDTGTLYDKVDKIENVSYENCPVVMDLTTESENHTFVTGGFVTHNCGLLRNLAITCHVSIGSSRTFIILKKFLDKYAKDKFIEVREMITEIPLYKIFLDGAWVISVDEKMVQFIVSKLKKLRRSLVISFDTCICLDKESKDLNIFTGSGRFCRPLIIVENMGLINEGNKDMSWNDLLSRGIIEYIDITEEEEIMIAMDLKQFRTSPETYTHMEIHPSVILGICAGIIPFSDHNQSPRNIYQSLHPDTLVTMENGLKKHIKDIKIGENVVTFDHNTLERSYSKVINQYVRPSENKMYTITTISGRTIIATDNHSFFTSEGFKEIRHFNKDTLIGVNAESITREYLRYVTYYNNDISSLSDFMSLNTLDVFGKFVKKVGTDTIFVPIDNITEYTKSNLIADITVENQDNHDFIANDLLSCNSSMGKQAMGIYASNFNGRFDTLAHVLHYPQKPLVTTTFMKYIKLKELPAGINAIVAIACYGGYNQEDSIIVNKGALDRGLFRSTFFKTYVDQEKEIIRVGGLMEQFEIPNRNETKGIQHGNYGKLANDGIIEPGCRVIENDIIIGKTTPIATSKQEINQMKKFKKRDVSTSMRQNEEGVVDKVLVTTNSDGFKYSKVKIRSTRIPVVGDKLACYGPDHDVLTDRGWIPISTMSMKDRVASLVNGTTLEYVYPTELMSYDYKGKMYNVESTQVSLLVTPNHRMWVCTCAEGIYTEKYGIQTAENIYGKRSKYLNNCEKLVPLKYDNFFENVFENITDTSFDIYDYDATNLNLIKNKCFSIPIDTWLMLFGIWISNAYGYYDEETRTDIVIINIDNEMVKNALDKIEIECIGQFCFSICLSEKLDGNNYIVGNEKMSKYLYCPGSKYFPNWIWCLNQDQCRTLFKGMMLGNDTESYDTYSREMCDYVQRLILHMGYSCNIESKNDSWTLNMIKSQNNPLVNKTVQQDSYIDYDDRVYCCTVPSGIIYVRRNGLNVWCGNSSHAQKGTIGMVYLQEDMPFTEDGIVPDLIINPHAIPSRMTIGHLIECLLGKVCTLTGKEGDATPFNGMQVTDVAKLLEECGYAGDGTEVLYNGESGEPMEARIFIGPTYYQRLKHMVNDKIHSRSTGPVTKLTRQPLEGRAKDGGLKLGEMERDVLCSHGAAYMLKDRMFYNSDPYRIHVCKLCGTICQADLDKQRFLCKCVKGGNTTEIVQVYIPYACKLFFQELMAMSIVPRIKV